MPIQTVIVSKTKAKTRAAAEKIAEKLLGKKVKTSRETETSFRFRQFPPEEIVKGTIGTKQVKQGVSIVTARKRGK